MEKECRSKTTYTGREVWVNQATGEVREVDAFNRQVGRNESFMIAYMGEVINMIETLGNKKMLVVKYILQEMCKTNNTLIATQDKIAKSLGISRKVVCETLKLLEDTNVIRREIGAIMLSPHFMNNWKAGKEASMMIKYMEFGSDGDESEK